MQASYRLMLALRHNRGPKTGTEMFQTPTRDQVRCHVCTDAVKKQDTALYFN